MRRILIVGGASAIAEAVARLYAARGDALYLVGRKADVLSAVTADLKVRGASVASFEALDANDLTAHAAMIDRAEKTLGGLDTVLIAYGSLGDQKACEASADLTVRELHNNAISVAALMTDLGNRFEHQRRGVIAVISSVAGDRGRQSNYVYGSAKALVTAFSSGLRQRLYRAGVAVVTIKPGFVDTPMTATFAKGPLWSKPSAVAVRIVRAIDRAATVVYVPSFWRPVMFVIRSIPEILFRRLSL
jgi:decaprenylphospho-beta-D-erythro-pentofuranosid-2-ulose 2-reductase